MPYPVIEKVLLTEARLAESASRYSELRQPNLKMNDRVTCVLDTQFPSGARVTTFVVKIPFTVHPELMTHRVFSRNAASQRGIRVASTIRRIYDTDYCMPDKLVMNEFGMQGYTEMDEDLSYKFRSLWRDAAYYAIRIAEKMDALGAHKQLVNRVLAPFRELDVIVTATEWSGFLRQRRSKYATHEMQNIASGIYEYLKKPLLLTERFIHLPFYTTPTNADEAFSVLRDHGMSYKEHHLPIAISSARVARVSYGRHGDEVENPVNDVKLFLELERVNDADEKDVHASPFEHIVVGGERDRFYSNFRGCCSYREARGYLSLQGSSGGYEI